MLRKIYHGIIRWHLGSRIAQTHPGLRVGSALSDRLMYVFEPPTTGYVVRMIYFFSLYFVQGLRTVKRKDNLGPGSCAKTIFFEAHVSG